MTGRKRDKGSEVAGTGATWAGMLTHVGVEQCAAVGTLLRDKYINNTKLLPGSWHPEAVYLRSTYFTRTLDTAAVSASIPVAWPDCSTACVAPQAIVSGLYPELARGATAGTGGGDAVNIVIYSAAPLIDNLDPSDEHGGRLKELLDQCACGVDVACAACGHRRGFANVFACNTCFVICVRELDAVNSLLYPHTHSCGCNDFQEGVLPLRHLAIRCSAVHGVTRDWMWGMLCSHPAAWDAWVNDTVVQDARRALGARVKWEHATQLISPVRIHDIVTSALAHGHRVDAEDDWVHDAEFMDMVSKHTLELVRD